MATPFLTPGGSPASYEQFTGSEYPADLIAEQAREFVRTNKDRPFFLYFSTTVPHPALQVPEDSLKGIAAEQHAKSTLFPIRALDQASR